MVVNGRFARFYMTGDFALAVTYHKRVGKRTRPMTLSPKLMERVLQIERNDDGHDGTHTRDDQGQLRACAATLARPTRRDQSATHDRK